MKKFKLFAFVTALCAVACQGTVDPGQETPEDAKTDLVGVITLHADKDLIKADGTYASNLTVMLTDSHGVQHDVTSDVEIYCEGQDLPISNPVFTTSEEGEYVFYAMRGFDISNSVTVRSVKGMPDLPSDPQASNTSFSHRMLLVQHTGSECPNCPGMMDILKHIADDDEYNTLYHHVASHSYNASDAAYSAAAQTLSKTFNTTKNYPMVTYNLTTEFGYIEEEIKSNLIKYGKETADAGISATSAVVGNKVCVNVSLKSAVDAKYRVAVWLLEDNIHSPQSGATSSWHNTHSNCLRYMYGEQRTECIYGKPIGMVEAGKTADHLAAFELDPSWVVENCKLMIIAVEAGGEYGLVNCTYCPLDGSVTYDYI